MPSQAMHFSWRETGSHARAPINRLRKNARLMRTRTYPVLPRMLGVDDPGYGEDFIFNQNMAYTPRSRKQSSIKRNQAIRVKVMYNDLCRTTIIQPGMVLSTRKKYDLHKFYNFFRQLYVLRPPSRQNHSSKVSKVDKEKELCFTLKINQHHLIEF